MKSNNLFLNVVFAVSLLAAPAAMAHSVQFDCKAEGEKHVVCEAGFSDGSDAAGMELAVMTYEDKALLTGTLDAKSQLRFERPSVDFYVRLDGGEGHTAEIDHADIR